MTLRARVVWVVALLGVPAAVLLAVAQHRLLSRARLDVVAEAAVERMQSGGRERCEEDPQAFVRSQTARRARLGGRAAGAGEPGSMGVMRTMRVRGPGANRAATRRQRQQRQRQQQQRRQQRRERRAQRRAAIAPLGGEAGAGRAFPYDADFTPTSPQSPRLPVELVERVREGEEYAVRERTGQGRRPGQYELLVPMPWTDGPCATLLVRTRIASSARVPSLMLGVVVALLAAFIVWLAVGPIVRRLRLLTRAIADERVDLDPLVQGKGALGDGTDEITQLARTFARQREEIGHQLQALKERDAAMIRYIANTTHDVMLPLTVLQGHLVAAGDALNPAETGVRERIGAAIEESHYLASLLRNLNAAARLDAGAAEIVRESVDLSELVERVVARHAQIATGRGVELVHGVPEAPVVVLGDVTLLERAVNNLVHNAVRYNVTGGHVAVVLSAREGHFSLRVIDDGPGVPDALFDRLGERGFRADDARSRRPNGMGLGLHIAKDVSARHGMTLRFAHSQDEDPSVGSGLTVVLTGALAGAVAPSHAAEG